MDLRKRLLLWLGCLLTGLLLMAAAISLHSLLSDIRTEVSASERLVTFLVSASQQSAHSASELENQLRDAGFRHIKIATRPEALQPDDHAPLARLLGSTPLTSTAHMIRLGEHQFWIAPNPQSEIEERLASTVRLCITLLLYSGATLLAAWWAADRALTPVRDLEAGLLRLADAQPSPLPAFSLREFSRVAQAINTLAGTLETARAARQQLARDLLSVQENERQTLARELHDDLGQSLTAIGLTAAYLERNAEQLDAHQITDCAGELKRDVRQIGEQLRHMLKRLRPHGLDAAGLNSALRDLVDGWQHRDTGIGFQLMIAPALPTVDAQEALVIYRIVQEGLTNVVRHSGATQCRIDVGHDPYGLLVRVEDDGKGLPEVGIARRGGLLGMEERVAMAGGSMTVSSTVPHGLRLDVRLPHRAQETEREEEA